MLNFDSTKFQKVIDKIKHTQKNLKNFILTLIIEIVFYIEKIFFFSIHLDQKSPNNIIILKKKKKYFNTCKKKISS